LLPTTAFVLLLLPLPTAIPALAQEAWQPPPPSPESKDWVQLSSKEWLRGEIKSKRDDVFEFDSEELDLLHLDWADVAEIRSPRTLTYVFEEGVIAVGPAAMQEGTIRVRTAAGVQEHPRRELLSIIEGKPSELNFWSGKLSVGLVGRAGNTDQSDLNALVYLRRDAPKSRLDINYNGNFGTLNGEQNVNNHRGTASFSLFLYRNIYVTLLSVELYSDEFQNIEIQYTLSAGGGIFLVRKSSLEIQVGLGAGYTKTTYNSVEAGQSPINETGSLIPSTSMDWDITDDIEWNLDYEGKIGVPDPKNSSHHLTGLFSIELWGLLDFTVSTTWDRVENPTANAEGVVPKPDDFRTALGLGLDF
jgi:hypothetical protein